MSNSDSFKNGSKDPGVPVEMDTPYLSTDSI
jgi:hypothetical protein